MVTPSVTTWLSVTLIGVTFGWTPAGEKATDSDADSGRVTQAGYEYEVRLTPADLDALRDGRADSLRSAVPENLKQIDRVRITVGQGPATRTLTAADQAIAEQRELEPVRRTVAKPVVPDWPDAATLTGERRTAYQNPLQQGFEDGTQSLSNAAEWTRKQTTAAADRLRSSVEASGDTLRNTAKELFDGTGRALEELVPDASQRVDQYGNPIDQYGRPIVTTGGGYDPNTARADPPLPTRAPQGVADEPQRPANPYARRQSPPFREPSRPASARDGFENPLYTESEQEYLDRQRGPALGRATNEGIVKRYTDDEEDTYQKPYRPRLPEQRELESVPRRRAQSTQFVDSRREEADDGFFSNDRSVGRRTYKDPGYADEDPSFPPLPGGRSFDPGFDDREPLASQSPRRMNTTPVSSDVAGSSWVNGNGEPNPDDQTSNTGAQQGATQPSDSTYFEKLLLVILGAVTCFTWIAYIDVRNKYRMALRGVPTAGFGHGVAA